MKQQIIVVLFAMSILTACIPATGVPINAIPQANSVPSPTISLIDTAKPRLTQPATVPELMTVATIQALNLKTPGSIEYVPNQVTDGKLLLSIPELESNCYAQYEQIPIDLIFHNLTPKPLSLRDKFDLAINRSLRGGNISLLISESNGEPLFTLSDFSLADYFDVSTPKYLEIPVGSDYKITISFVFPKEKVLTVTTNKLETIPTIAGNYFIRFLYFGYDENAWSGMIASNQLEICIK